MTHSPYQMIDHKKRGGIHSDQDLQQFVDNYLAGDVRSEEMAAWLMAVYFQGLNDDETTSLTKAMVASGDCLTWDKALFDGHPLVDKHSSGGVGDKTTLIALPLFVAAGGKAVKLSGRSLGHTGGTLDKLEAIPGFRTDLSIDEIHAQVMQVGLYVGGQTQALVPADKALYALRDRTATVDSIPLIASSIMSKKLAAGADAFVFDIKVGKGAFMASLEEGEALARSMAGIARQAGKKATFVLSRMDAPLGDVGNGTEVAEALAILRGSGGNPGLKELSLVLATEMHSLYFNSQTSESRAQVEEALTSGQALRVFNALVQAQGGHLQRFFAEEPEFTYDYYAKASGIITGLDAGIFGRLGHILGTGPRGQDPLHPTSGFVFDRHLGDPVYTGQRIFQVRYEMSRADALEEAMDLIDDAITIEKDPAYEPPAIVLKILRPEDL